MPTLKESGYDVVVDAPNGVAAPAGVPDQVLARLRAAFASAAASEEFKTACARIDAPIMYLDGPKYQEYVTAMLAHEKSLIERLNLKALLASS